MTTLRRVRVIVNPSARSGRGQRDVRRAQALASRVPLFRSECVESRSAEQLRDSVLSVSGLLREKAGG